MQSRIRILLAAFSLAAVTLSARPSHADDCSVALAPLFSAGGAHIKMSISTVDVSWVSYTDGFIRLSGGWITGALSQLFSDRMAAVPNSFISQPFNISAPDTHTPYIGSSGEVWIWNNTWGFWTHFFGQCSGGFLYGVVDGAMITIAATPWTPPPPPR